MEQIEFAGIETAQPAPGVVESITECDLVIICPSNPYVSIDPILKVNGLMELISSKTVVAVSPIIGGQAVKGPLAKMIQELEGAIPSAIHPAKFYHQLSILTGYILDSTRFKADSRDGTLGYNL